MEDYVFLIVAVVLAVFGALNQNRKKKIESDPIVKSGEKSEFHFMDLLDHDFFDAPNENRVEQVRTIPGPAKTVKERPDEPSRPKFYHQSFKSTLPNLPKQKTVPTIKKETESEEVAEEDYVNYLEDFSLRKAFVYSEILTRKY